MASPPRVVTISACRRPAGWPAARVVADQQVGEDRGQLPEHVEQQQVVGDDQAEHRPGEGDEHGGEPAQPGVVGAEVAGAVDQHQRADAADQQHHQPGQGGDPQRDVEAGAGRSTGTSRRPRRRRGPPGCGPAPSRTRRPARGRAGSRRADPTSGPAAARAGPPPGAGSAVRARALQVEVAPHPGRGTLRPRPIRRHIAPTTGDFPQNRPLDRRSGPACGGEESAERAVGGGRGPGCGRGARGGSPPAGRGGRAGARPC